MPMPNGDPLPEEIVLSRSEAAQVLFVLDAAIDAADVGSPLIGRLEAAARVLIEKFLPDLPEL
jgi:hypothetical protein